jgi:hypothetical protein
MEREARNGALQNRDRLSLRKQGSQQTLRLRRSRLRKRVNALMALRLAGETTRESRLGARGKCGAEIFLKILGY